MKSIKISTKAIFLINFMFIVLLTGCQASGNSIGAQQPIESTVIINNSVVATPAVNSNTTFNSPVTPSLLDSGELQAVFAQITPEATTGGVIGQLFDTITLQPINDEFVYLAEITGTDKFPVAALDRTKAPHTSTDAGGIFQFANIKEGKYVIIVGSEGNGGMIQDGAKGTTLLVDVKKGKVTNIGQIIIEKP